MKAFPNFKNVGTDISTGKPHYEHCDGMDLRDYFAIHATDNDIFRHQVSESGFKEIRTRAEARYMFADEMIEARKK